MMVLLLRQNSETTLAPRLPRYRPPNRHESLALLGNQSLSRYIDVATLPHPHLFFAKLSKAKLFSRSFPPCFAEGSTARPLLFLSFFPSKTLFLRAKGSFFGSQTLFSGQRPFFGAKTRFLASGFPSLVGFEPTTFWLTASCSTPELQERGPSTYEWRDLNSHLRRD